MQIELRPSEPADIEWLVELRATVLRSDLERLGRFDPVRVRERMRGAFLPAQTRIIVVDGVAVGSVTVRPEDGVRWIEHFYLASEAQGKGAGSEVLRRILEESRGTPMKLNVLQGSAARRLYARHGFTVDTEDAVDVFMTLDPPQ